VPKRCKLAERAYVGLLAKRINALRRNAAPAAKQDVDGIHDFRVASRRLRAALREVRPGFSKGPLGGVEDRAEQVTDLLGQARELDVSIQLLDELAEEIGSEAESAAARSREYMRELRTYAAPDVEKAAGLVNHPEFELVVADAYAGRKTPTKCMLNRAVDAIGSRYKKLLRVHEQWLESRDNEHLHKVRIALKKLRYVCESYAGVYGQPMETFIGELKDAQTILGNWNDLRVLRGYVSKAAKDAPGEEGPAFERLSAVIGERMSAYFGSFEDKAGWLFNESGTEKLLLALSAPAEPCDGCTHTPPSSLEALD
jgi:CHAD domain-containing protein